MVAINVVAVVAMAILVVALGGDIIVLGAVRMATRIVVMVAWLWSSAYGLKNLRGIPFQFQVRREFKSDGNTIN